MLKLDGKYDMFPITLAFQNNLSKQVETLMSDDTYNKFMTKYSQSFKHALDFPIDKDKAGVEQFQHCIKDETDEKDVPQSSGKILNDSRTFDEVNNISSLCYHKKSDNKSKQKKDSSCNKENQQKSEIMQRSKSVPSCARNTSCNQSRFKR